MNIIGFCWKRTSYDYSYFGNVRTTHANTVCHLPSALFSKLKFPARSKRTAESVWPTFVFFFEEQRNNWQRMLPASWPVLLEPHGGKSAGRIVPMLHEGLRRLVPMLHEPFGKYVKPDETNFGLLQADSIIQQIVSTQTKASMNWMNEFQVFRSRNNSYPKLTFKGCGRMVFVRKLNL